MEWVCMSRIDPRRNYDRKKKISRLFRSNTATKAWMYEEK